MDATVVQSNWGRGEMLNKGEDWKERTAEFNIIRSVRMGGEASKSSVSEESRTVKSK
jgi:hypothetical protein